MAGRSGVQTLETSPQGCDKTFLLYGFNVGSAALQIEHRRFLREKVADILSARRNSVALIGRSSRSGPERQNLRLSRHRAEAAASLLQKEGVDRERIDVDFQGENSPFTTDRESPVDRSVEVRIRVPQELVLVLQDVGVVRQSRVLIRTIREALEPLVRSSGRQLNIVRSAGDAPGDLTLVFDPGGHETRPCGLLILGVEGGGTIFVGAHRDLRVCCGPRRDAADPKQVDYVSQIERVFEEDEDDFARAVAYTALHELGHIIANLEHSDDAQNIMITGNLPRERRSRENMRRFFAGEKHFSEQQKKKLICAIQTGHYVGGMRVRGR